MTSATIFQASDLNQRGRAILDSARQGCARLRDKDGFGLVMLPEKTLQALRTVANSVANLSVLEHTLAGCPSHDKDIYGFGDWTWLRAFDEDDLKEFVREMRDALLVASREENSELVDETLDRWRTTAETLGDPLRRSILLGVVSEDDFSEVPRPE